jgi:hypothetical protein
MEKAAEKPTVKQVFKIVDFFVITVFISLIIFSFVLMKSASSENLHLLVQTPSGQYIYPLDKDTEFSVQGENGKTCIRIKDNSAAILDSECPNKTCVTSGKIKKYGEWIACIPNRVLIRIEKASSKSDKNNLDAVSF